MPRYRALCKEQTGNSLPLSLIALTFGVLIVTPLLAFVSARLEQTTHYEDYLKAQYVSDAAAEYAIWRLVHDANLRASLEQPTHPEITLTLPATFPHAQDSLGRRIIPSAKIKISQRPFDYSVYGNSQTCSTVIDWTGSKNRIIGNIHSNRNMRIQGTSIEGMVTYVTEVEAGPNTTFDPPPPASPAQSFVIDMPPLFDMADFADPTAVGTAAYRAAQEGKYHYIEGNWSMLNPSQPFDGLYYVTGNLKIGGSSSHVSGTATFVARGTIELQGSKFELKPYTQALSLFTDAAFEGSSRCTTPVIKISNSGVSTDGGYVYAPNGLIKISGSGTFAGALIGDSVDFSGSGLTIQPPPLSGSPTSCGLYDILATAEATRTDTSGTTYTPSITHTSVRVLYCGDNDVRLRSWTVSGQAGP